MTRLLAYALGFDMPSAIQLGEASGQNDNDDRRHAPTLFKRSMRPWSGYSSEDYLRDARRYHFPTDASMLERWDEFKASPTFDTWGNLAHNRQEWAFDSHRNNRDCWHGPKGDLTARHLSEAYHALWLTKDLIQNYAWMIKNGNLKREANPLTDIQICTVFDALFKSKLEGSWSTDYQKMYDRIVLEINRYRKMNLSNPIE